MARTSLLFLAALFVSAHGFATIPFQRREIAAAFSATTTSMSMASDPEKEEDSEGLDLDLGEMFDMFEAADNEDDFDDAMKQVKGGSK